jgi:hypothetical protein
MNLKINCPLDEKGIPGGKVCPLCKAEGKTRHFPAEGYRNIPCDVGLHDQVDLVEMVNYLFLRLNLEWEVE